MLNIFEEKNNTVAFLLIVVAAFLIASFGLIAATVSITKNPAILFTTFGYFTACIFSFLFCKSLKINISSQIVDVLSIPSIKKFLFFRIIFGFGFFFFFAGIFLISNKLLAPLVYEISPVISVIISYFLLKDYYTKDSSLTYTWSLILLSLLGVVLLFAKDALVNDLIFSQEIYGLLLILLGSIFRAFATVISPKINLILREQYPENSAIKSAAIIQFMIICSVFTISLLFSLYFYELNDFARLLDVKILLLLLLFGLFEDISNILVTLAGSLATSHNIFIARLLTPIIGIFLLWFFGFGEINATIVLAFILILVPNILLNLDIEESFSFKATFVWILLFAIVLFYYQGKPIDSETYFNSANALLVFFALMVGYLISKLNERSDFREQLFMRFLHKIRADGVDEKLVESISAKFQQANNRLTDEVKNKLQKSEIKIDKYSEILDFKFIQNRRLYNIGELFVLLLISLLLIGITTLYRDHNFLYDSYAFIISIAVVFTLAQVVEKMFFSEYTQKSSNNIFMGNVIGTVFLAILTLAIIVLFLSKHNFVL